MFDVIMYADDTTLFSSINHFHKHLLNKTLEFFIIFYYELQKIHEWINITRLSLNMNKCNVMSVHIYARQSQKLIT